MTIRLDNKTPEEIDILRGIRQKCSIAAFLNLYSEKKFLKTLNEKSERA